MRQLAINEFTTMKWTFEEDVRAYAEGGFHGIGVVRDKVQAVGVEPAARLLQEHGLQVTDLCVAGWFTQTDSSVFDQQVEDGRQAIEMSARLDADALILLVGPPGTLTFDEAGALLRRALDQILPLAEQLGTRLALEPCHPMYRAEASFLMTLAEALDVCEAVDSPALGVWLDTYHLWWDNSLFDQLPRARDRIFGVHINDFKQTTQSLRDHAVPGEGIIPLRRILEAIEAAGWNGTYTIEIFCDRFEPEHYADVLRRCREGFAAIWH